MPRRAPASPAQKRASRAVRSGERAPLATPERSLLHDGPRDAARTLVLAHGAGAPMDSPFMQQIARGLGATGVHVVRFEFPYMHARRAGVRRGPDRMPVLQDTFRAVVAQLGDPRAIVVGGKSMGGRIASMLADELGVAGLLCLGYPFHPPGRPAQLRISHLARLRTPALILQGTRDRFGTPDEVAGYALSPSLQVQYIEGGEHSFRPLKRSGRSEAQALDEAVALAAAFIAAR